MRRLLFGLVCRVFGHKHRKVGFADVPGWRRAALVQCTRCRKLWRGVKP